MPVRFIPNPLLAQQVKLSPEMNAAMRLIGESVAQKASDLAPRLTGALAASISAHATGPSEVEIVADVPYAAFVEYGTSDTEPAPYLRPALEAIVGR
jgi:HK97 gp10 family phage protein